MLQCLEEKTMRNIVYLCLILFFILHNVKSKSHDNTRSELHPNSKKPIRAGEKMDISKFVDVLLKDAKRIDQKHKKNGNHLRQATAKRIMKTVDEGLESSYDSLGLDENKKDLIVRSNKPDLDLQKMGQMFRPNNQGLDYKKMGQILRSNAGSDSLKMQKAILRSVDRPSDEKGSELLFDLEDEDGLKNPLF